ncbi:MAG: integrase, partial [Proteobacteria bacterium]|nr:integrase [Pseudomonadota bacterium]
MNESRLATLEQIREFLAGTCDMVFAIPADEPRRRAFVAKVLHRFRYDGRPKGQRGVLFEYMQRLSGYSRQHLSRLIAQYRHRHSIEPASRASRTSFSRKYQPA